MACFAYQGKSIYYEECGRGTPLIFLHGNTASSKLFLPILALYSGRYRCICPDFLGNGRSDRVKAFSTDLWQDEGLAPLLENDLLPHLAKNLSARYERDRTRSAATKVDFFTMVRGEDKD